MILKKAREYATDFAEQAIDAAVITVPPYFTQSERRAVKRACELANIKLLQLMNDNAAVALNYGIFRRKDFNATGTTYLFYDMGAQSTTCTIATYNIIKSKEHGYVEEVPQVTIRAVAFDRDLGGLEFQIRLRDFLAKKFHEKHPKLDLYKNPKALAKLFREAERAKHVLSANNEYTAQVEGLVDEIDFKQRVTREDFETLCADLFERVKKSVEEVLATSGIALVSRRLSSIAIASLSPTDRNPTSAALRWLDAHSSRANRVDQNSRRVSGIDERDSVTPLRFL